MKNMSSRIWLPELTSPMSSYHFLSVKISLNPLQASFFPSLLHKTALAKVKYDLYVTKSNGKLSVLTIFEF